MLPAGEGTIDPDLGEVAPGSIIVRVVGRPSSRRLTHSARLELAIIAESVMRPRGRTKRRPDVMIEPRRLTRLTSKTSRARINSTSTGAQLAYANDREHPAYWPTEFVKFVVP